MLLAQLDLGNVRELEDLIIDCIYAGIIKGKLDQKQQRFQVDWTMGRDIRPGQLSEMIRVLTHWYCPSDNHHCSPLLPLAQPPTLQAGKIRHTDA